MVRLRYVLIAVIVGCFAGAAPAAVIEDSELGFTLTLPRGFTEFPEGKEGPDIVYAWIRGNPAAGEHVVIMIERLGGVIGREDLSKEVAKHKKEMERKGLKDVAVFKERWKDAGVTVFRMTIAGDDFEAVSLVAQVPLKREAIQVGVSSEVGREAESRAVLKEVLAGLDGESNWFTGEGGAGGLMKGLLPVGIAVAVVVIIFCAVRRRR